MFVHALFLGRSQDMLIQCLHNVNIKKETVETVKVFLHVCSMRGESIVLLKKFFLNWVSFEKEMGSFEKKRVFFRYR